MATTADISNGKCIEFNHDIYKIVEFQHVKPGKGPAFVRTKLKSVTSGKVLDNTFSAGHKITFVTVRTKKFQFLYIEGESYIFMDSATYDQIPIDPDLIEGVKFLKDGAEVDVLVKDDDDTVLGAELPAKMTFTVAYTEPGVKGDTATNATKEAELETGVKVQVPLFINQDEEIIVDTRSGSYLGRAK